MSPKNNDQGKLFVELSAVFDFSRLESFSRSCLFEESSKPTGGAYFQVDSLKTASELSRKYIERHNLGASN